MYTGHRLALLLLCTAFIATGLVVASLGPALPELARQTDRSLAQLGTLFIALFGGGLIAQSASGPISDRFGRRIVLIVSSATFGAAMLALSLSTSLPAVLVFASFCGIGYGGTSLSVNVLSSELTPHRRASTVNLVNVFFGVGAIAGPLLSGLALERWGTPLPALQIGAVLLLIVSPMAAIVSLPGGHHRASAPESVPASKSMAAATAGSVSAPAAVAAAEILSATTLAPDRAAAHPTPAGSSSFVWSCACLLLLYAGSEASVGSWTPVYLRQSTVLDAAQAAIVTSTFWTSLCVGRVLAVVGGMHITAERLLLASFATAAAGGLLLVAGHGIVWLSVAALALLGLAFGPVYPTIMAVVTAAYPRTAGAAASRLGALASIGGMVLPSVHGLLIARVGTLPSAALTLTTALSMVGAWFVIRQRYPDLKPD